MLSNLGKCMKLNLSEFRHLSQLVILRRTIVYASSEPNTWLMERSGRAVRDAELFYISCLPNLRERKVLTLVIIDRLSPHSVAEL